MHLQLKLLVELWKTDWNLIPFVLPSRLSLQPISIFSLSSFAFFYSHSSSLLSRLSFLSTLSLPVFLFLFSYPSYLFLHSSSHHSLFPSILYLPFHIFPPFLLCPLKIALLLSFYAQFLFHSSWSSSSLFLLTFFLHIFPFFLLLGSLLPFLPCSPTPKMTLQWPYLTGKWHNIVKIRNTSVLCMWPMWSCESSCRVVAMSRNFHGVGWKTLVEIETNVWRNFQRRIGKVVGGGERFNRARCSPSAVGVFY